MIPSLGEKVIMRAPEAGLNSAQIWWPLREKKNVLTKGYF